MAGGVALPIGLGSRHLPLESVMESLRVPSTLTATLKDGQTLMGLLKRQDANGIEIKDLAGRSHTAKSSDIANLTALPVSLMPEGLLGDLDDAALRDFFSYLMKP
jgi:putative heme-binding domain-containing protein